MRTLIAMLAVGCSAPVTSPTTAVAPTEPPPPTPVAQPAPPPPPPATPSINYPHARRGDVVETHHGVKVADPYRWLEDMDSAETRAWVAQENAQTDAYLRKLPGAGALRARITELLSYESFRLPFHRGTRYFWLHSDATTNQPIVWTATGLDAKPTKLLDPNTISTDGSLAFVGLAASHAGTRIAYGLAHGGGDWQTWHIRDVATAKDLPDELDQIKYYRPAFTHDGTGVYYSRFPSPPPGKELVETDHDCKLYYHRIGTPAASDVVVHERPDHPTWQFDAEVTDVSVGDVDGHFQILHGPHPVDRNAAIHTRGSCIRN